MKAGEERAVVWHQGGGEAARTGRTAGHVGARGEPIWALPMTGSVEASPVCDTAGRLYVADTNETVRCFDQHGRRQWEALVPGGVVATPALDGREERLFVGTVRGWVVALRAEDGRELWRQEIPTDSDPRIVGDVLVVEEPARKKPRLVVSSWGGRYWALDLEKGRPISQWEAGISPSARAAADAEGNVWSLRAIRKVGVELIRTDPNAKTEVITRVPRGERPVKRQWVVAGPVVDLQRGRVWFCGNRDRDCQIVAVDLRTGRELFRRSWDATVCADPGITARGLLVFGDMQGRLVWVDLEREAIRSLDLDADYVLAGPVCDREANGVWIGLPDGRVIRVRGPGHGVEKITELPRAVVGQLSVRSDGGLVVPCTDHQVYVWSEA